MKRLIFFLGAFLLMINTALAQDYIYLRNGSMIQGTVKSANLQSVTYIPATNPEGPEVVINSSEVLKIVFANGYVREFEAETGKKEKQKKTKTATPTPRVTSDSDNYFALAAGAGRSYGGVGLRAQGRFGKQMGFGVHGGFGYNPASIKPSDRGGICWGLGVKYFAYKWAYLNFQAGTVNYEYVYDYFESEGKEGYFGLSLLVGVDYFFNDHIGVNGAIGNTLAVGSNYSENKRRLTFDAGFVFKF